MAPLYWASLAVIAATWISAWRWGWRWTRSCGVAESVGSAVLACTVPTAGLLASVHGLALLALAFEWRCVTPVSTCLVFAAGTLLMWRLLPQDRERSDNRRPVNELLRLARCGYLWLPVGIIVVMYSVFLADALTRYPTGYDARMYHLPGAAQWMQQQSLTFRLGEIHDAFPENGMIVAFLLAFPRIEWLFPLVHLPKGLLAAGAVFGLIRAVGYRRRTAFMGGCITFSVPIVVFQSYSGYVDLYAAAAWLASLLALVWAVRAPSAEQRRSLLIMAGLSAGISLGSKTTFLVLSTLLGCLAVVLEWLRPCPAISDPRRPFFYGAVFAAAALVCSGFWFVRGAVVAGNPVYPLAIVVGDHELLPGYTADRYFPHRTISERLERWWAYAWKETKYSGTGYPYSVNNALGAPYATFVVPGVLLAIGLALRRRRAAIDRARFGLLVLSLSGIVLLLTVFHEMLRFVLPQILLAIVVASFFIERVSLLRPRATVALLSASLAVTAILVTLQPVHAMAGRARDGIRDRASFYEIPQVVDDFPVGTRVLNLADPSYVYPLMGSNLTNEVIIHWRWTEKHGEGPLSPDALHADSIDYIYVDATWDGNWPDDLPLELVYDSVRQTPHRDRPRTRLWRVGAVVHPYAQVAAQ